MGGRKEGKNKERVVGGAGGQAVSRAGHHQSLLTIKNKQTNNNGRKSNQLFIDILGRHPTVVSFPFLKGLDLPPFDFPYIDDGLCTTFLFNFRRAKLGKEPSYFRVDCTSNNTGDIVSETRLVVGFV